MPDMNNLRKILAKRLEELMAGSISLDTQTKVARASGVSQASIQRALAESHAASIDMIEAIAKAFKINPRHFLLEEQDRKTLQLFSKLDRETKTQLLSYLNSQESNMTLNFSVTLPVKPGMQAASLKAAARPVTAKSDEASKNETERNLSKRKQSN